MRFALRSLGVRVASALFAVGTLAVGVGLATAVFSLSDLYLWKQLPYSNPEQLVTIHVDPLNVVMVGGSQGDVPQLPDWQARNDLFAELAAFSDKGLLRARVAGRTVPLRAVAVTENLLELLGGPSHGRAIALEPTDALVSHRISTRTPHGELSPGRSVSLLPSGQIQVAGVLPHSFLVPEPNRTDAVDLLVALQPGPIATIDRSRGVTSVGTLNLVARLRDGVGSATVEAALNAEVARVGLRVSVIPLGTAMRAHGHQLAFGAFVASVVVVGICCVNMFGIALTRGLYRGADLVTMTVLGATRARITRLFLAEAAVVTIAGFLIGVGLASIVVTTMTRLMPAEYLSMGTPAVTIRSIGFAAVAASVALGSWTAGSLGAWRFGVRSRSLVRKQGALRALRFCVSAFQVCASCVLLVGAGLLGRSYLNLMRVDTGINEQAYVISVAHDPQVSSAVLGDIVDDTLILLRRSLGVRATGASSGLLLNGKIGLATLIAGGGFASVEWTKVTPGYFDAAGLRFVAGRPPGPDERLGIVVNETLAERLFGERSPVGEALPFRGVSLPILGVVKDVRSISLSTEPMPAVFELAREWTAGTTVSYLVRGSGMPSATDWEHVIQSVDPSAIVLDGSSIRERLLRSVRNRTFAMFVLSLFAVASVLVTVAGVTTVVAFSVAKRTREIGIRLALGARRRSVMQLVMRDTLVATGAGAATGLIVATWLSKSMERLLYGVPHGNFETPALMALGLVAISLAAAAIPASRAGRIDPVAAMRSALADE